ncbi:MAG TPA: hypothetical protein VLJ14_12105 [Ktedonobacterales bacterium]|jgi:hypothetical protein|nr:hypothetical protein [Ktedonobacterales bacterium]
MSEIQPTSTSTATAAPQTSTRRPRLWLASRVLATAGAVLFAIGAWMPWFAVTGHATVNGLAQDFRYEFAPGAIDGPLGFFGWSVLTVAGVLSLPLLWSRSRPILQLIGAFAFFAWTSLILLVGNYAFLLAPKSTLTLVPETGLSQSQIVALDALADPRRLSGFVLGELAIGISVFAMVLIFIGPMPHGEQGASTGAPTLPSARFRIPGMGILTTGIVLWALGTLVLPWASVGCPGVVLLAAQCSGLNYSGVLRLGISSTALAFDPLAAVYTIPTLLAAGALLMLITTWWGQITPTFCLWVTLWLAAAALFIALGTAGVRDATTNAARLGLPAGTWQPDSGGTLTVVALAVVAVATGVLWYGLPRRRRPSGAA